LLLLAAFISTLTNSSPDLSDKIESYRISMYTGVGFLVLLSIALYVLPNSKKASPQIVKMDGEQVFQKQEIVHNSIKSAYEHFKQG